MNRNVLRDVKKQQAAIEVKLKDTQSLKLKLSEVAADIETVRKERRGEQSIQAEKNEEKAHKQRPHSSGPAGPQQRTIILTPGGTKRKGKSIT